MHAIDRRTFIADMGKGAFAIAVLGVAACSPAATASPVRSAAATSSGSAPTPSDEPASTPAGSAPPSGSAPSGEGTVWERVNLGFVSAYILVRGSEAAIVDTGVEGSAGSIEEGLTAVGLDWSSVGHLILTHLHADHAGSAADVMELAPDATGYAGEADIPGITVPRPLTPVGDGDSVFGLRIIHTPGHTPGSISVFDPVGSYLVAGDALRTASGFPTMPGEQFSEDMAEAARSVAKLGALTFETLLVGHGEPIETGASAAVAELAASR